MIGFMINFIATGFWYEPGEPRNFGVQSGNRDRKPVKWSGVKFPSPFVDRNCAKCPHVGYLGKGDLLRK